MYISTLSVAGSSRKLKTWINWFVAFLPLFGVILFSCSVTRTSAFLMRAGNCLACVDCLRRGVGSFRLLLCSEVAVRLTTLRLFHSLYVVWSFAADSTNKFNKAFIRSHHLLLSKYSDWNTCNWNSGQLFEKNFPIQIFNYHVLLTTIDVALSAQLCICEKNSKDDWFLPRPPKNLSSVSRTILYLQRKCFIRFLATKQICFLQSYTSNHERTVVFLCLLYIP